MAAAALPAKCFSPPFRTWSTIAEDVCNVKSSLVLKLNTGTLERLVWLLLRWWEESQIDVPTMNIKDKKNDKNRHITTAAFNYPSFLHVFYSELILDFIREWESEHEILRNPHKSF